jgi:ABC-2 type transport system ATP-binding protein
LAIALLGDPELLVLDEPTVGLDPLLRRDLWNLFQTMAHAGKTLIISSHVMDEAAHCEQLLLLREGKLLWSDSQAKLLQATKLGSVEEAFIKLMKASKS